MTTLVIHGTMTVSAAQKHRWWWDSWGGGGFLAAVRTGLQQSGGDDLWTVRGVPVSDIEALQPRRSWLTGSYGQLSVYRGHFIWTGVDQPDLRRVAGEQLVQYLNAIHDLAPEEPIRLIAHSHGCNVVKLASADRRLAPGIHFSRAVFLACPHFTSAVTAVIPYRLDPRRFGAVANLYSERDSVQVAIAQALPAMYFGGRHEMAVDSRRTDPDPAAARVYENFAIPTEDEGTGAHSALHGGVLGLLTGYWLGGGQSFAQILAQFGRKLLPVPRGDHGA